MSADEYTPTTEDVREHYLAEPEDRAEFDRWLRGELARAWDEGFMLATRNSPLHPHPMLNQNPYRKVATDE